MKDTLYGELSVIGMKGCEQFVMQVDSYLKQWRRYEDSETFTVSVDCPRFGTGEAKALLHNSLRGHDVYIICDTFNYGVKYEMYGQMVPMSPDDHYADQFIYGRSDQGYRSCILTYDPAFCDLYSGLSLV